MDETKLHRDSSKGSRAQMLLDNELLTEAFKTLEDTYTKAWRSTLVDQASDREKLFLAVNIVGKVRDHLASVVMNGKLAQAELKALNATSERKKLFG